MSKSYLSKESNPNWRGGHEISCPTCGKLHWLCPYEIKSGRKFCSYECWEIYIKKGIPSYTTKICPSCNKEFEYRTAEKQKYCSKECSNLAKRSERKVYICPTCGKEVVKRISRTKDWSITFCSIACRGKYYTGPKSILWTGSDGYRGYGEKWTPEIREKIRSIYNYQCALCGTIPTKFHKKLDVHHIDSNKKNNSYWNLIALCKSCHAKTKTVDRSPWERLFGELKIEEMERVADLEVKALCL